METRGGIDAARERWWRKRDALGLPDTGGIISPTPGGLARWFSEISTRIVVLPGDPFRTDLEFGEDLWEWWEEDRETPFGDNAGWNSSRPTVDAAVRIRSFGNNWDACLALHRYGGVELISHDFYQLRDGVKALRLVRSVALVWIAIDAQARVLRHFDTPGPWQIILALYDTEESLLGDVAQGWAEPYEMLAYDAPRCPEPNILIIREIDEFPGQSGFGARPRFRHRRPYRGRLGHEATQILDPDRRANW